MKCAKYQGKTNQFFTNGYIYPVFRDDGETFWTVDDEEEDFIIRWDDFIAVEVELNNSIQEQLAAIRKAEDCLEMLRLSIQHQFEPESKVRR